MLSECLNSFSVGGFAPLDPQPGLCPGPAWDIKRSPDSLSLGAYIIICYAPALCLINITLNPLKHRPTCIKALYPFVHGLGNPKQLENSLTHVTLETPSLLRMDLERGTKPGNEFLYEPSCCCCNAPIKHF